MAGAPPPRRASPPALPDELVEEILLRLPSDEPAWLLRASLISKAWGRTISSPAFRRRLHEFHRTPPVLGFLHEWDEEGISNFIPTTASSFSLVAPDWHSWRALDYRHGRALFLSHLHDQGAQELLVWEPITGAQRRVPVPELFEAIQKFRSTLLGRVEDLYPGAAVFCAADGCDHRGCHGGPFGLVFVFTHDVPDDDDAEEFDIWSCVFSSETGTWSKPTLTQSEFSTKFTDHYCVLVGRSLLYFMHTEELILQYDLASHSMTLLHPPGIMPGSAGRFNIMLTEDGGLGVAEYSNANLKLWTKEASDGTDAHWVLSRVISLVNLLPIGALPDADSSVEVVGFAEGTNTIFLSMVGGIFTIELQLEKAGKVCDRHGFGNLFPVVSFYTPVPRAEHQDPPSSGPSEEAGGEEGGESEKAIEQPQPLFGKGSSAAIVEGGFVNVRCSHALQTRVPSQGEVALECASTEYGCALLYKAQAMNDPLDDVPKSASNEESVMGTNSKDDARNSKVEDAAPSQKHESKEGTLLCTIVPFVGPVVVSGCTTVW